ncbi:MAG: aldo/keto reductase [Ilumatobacteraceae bacterium]
MIGSRVLGHSGLQVSSIALGTMMFGSWGNTDVDECVRMFDRALDSGITLFDTADMYDAGASEEILGQALRVKRSQPARDRVVLATKCGNPMSDDPAQRGLSRRWIHQACDDSLRRLGVEHIDLYQMHRPDPSTPVAETLGAFDELIKAGKIGAYGTSTFTAAQLQEMFATAASLNVPAPTSEQPPYSALARGVEAEVLPLCRANDVGVIAWAPLNGGWLTGKYQVVAGAPAGALSADSRAARKGEHFDHRDEAMRTRKLTLVDALIKVAAGAGLTLKQMALGFVLDDPAITAAIIGPRTLAQLDDLLGNGAPILPAGVRDAIDALVAPGTNVNPYDAG